MDSPQIGQKLLEQSFAKDELSFLFTYEDFATAAPRVVTLEDGQQLVAIGQELIKRAWLRASKNWPGNKNALAN